MVARAAGMPETGELQPGVSSVTDPGRAIRFERDVVVIGGCGHVGLPLAIALAGCRLTVAIHDISEAAVAAVSSAILPFAEPGAQAPLAAAIASGALTASADPAVIATAEHVIVAVAGSAGLPPGGGPLSVAEALAGYAAHFRDGQILILRSTVSPGGTARLEKMTADLGLDMDVAFCPERIAEGRAMTELFEFPQIVASRTPRGQARAGALLRRLAPALVPMSPEEAELAKLFANAWRYLRFAAANQLYMIANDRGLDFERIRQGLIRGYPRAADLPQAGFAAGPCLVKDTLALAECHADFPIGQAAIEINEGLPDYLAARLEQRFELRNLTVGILGMAFKGGSDDTRGSLAYRLRRILAAKARRVLCTDPLVSTDPELLPLDRVLAEADLLVIAAPHPRYREIVTDKPVADPWNVLGTGVHV
jgi:UDP-N-acetyl-D-mannosaminuronic acid dehydrogenase